MVDIIYFTCINQEMVRYMHLKLTFTMKAGHLMGIFKCFDRQGAHLAIHALDEKSLQMLTQCCAYVSICGLKIIKLIVKAIMLKKYILLSCYKSD